MHFDSADYFFFLLVAQIFYWSMRQFRVVRLLGLIALGCAFYGTLAPPGDTGRQIRYVVLMVGAATIDYWAANQIAKSTDAKVRKAWLVTSIVVNMSLLGTFKYWNFALGSVRDGAKFFGHDLHVPLHELALPVGISFYTFETMSYTLDVYRGHVKPAKSLLDFVLFISFFPKLVAGPIVRAADFLPQIAGVPILRRQQVSEGLFLIGTGLVKKVIFANYIGVNLVDRVFRSPDLFTTAETVVGLYAFTLQMFCDFSGYTDLARGSAKLFGLELNENFDRPYMATSIAEFWRRWHMTLSTWLRDYLYYPLGGSKVGGARAYFNLWLTMFLIGLWHGAKWTFVLYGTLQGLAMVAHRFWTRRAGAKSADGRAMTVLKIFVTMQFVVFTRILFRADDFANAGDVGSRLFAGTFTMANVPGQVWLALGIGFAAHYTPRAWYARIRDEFCAMHPVAQGLATALVFAITSVAATPDIVPFIYENF